MVNSATQIAIDIEERIMSGALAPGAQLPSVRDYADDLQVSPTTVAAAYRKLRDRGLVTGRGRQGTCVATIPHASVQASPTIPEGLVNALTGSPNPDFLPSLTDAFARAVVHPRPHYGGPLILDELATAARREFSADNIDAAHLTVTSGAMDAVARVLTSQSFRPGDRIGVEDPGHIPVHQLVRSAGLELVPLAVDQQGITVEALRAAVDRGLHAVIVTPRAQNPTGAALTVDRAEQLSEVLAPHPSVTVIHDDHAGPIAGPTYVAINAPGPRWATIRSVGKAFGPDLRVALVAGDATTIGRVDTAISNGPGWVSHILQRATAHLFTDPVTTRVVEHACATYQDRRDRLVSELASHGIQSWGTSGLNVWIPSSNEQSDVEAARRAGFAIRGAELWRIDSPPAVRVTVGALTDQQIVDLAQGLADGRSPAARPNVM